MRKRAIDVPESFVAGPLTASLTTHCVDYRTRMDQLAHRNGSEAFYTAGIR